MGAWEKKPPDIPQDVWQAAEEAEPVARANLAERERGQRQLFWLMSFYGYGAERPHGLFTDAEWDALEAYDGTVMAGVGGA